jgi:phosphoribosylformylglycinamidine (FGAM) synthase-like amidotransferase family enzyme
MTDIMSILRDSYTNAAADSTPPVKPNYVNVQSSDYQGTWTGKYSDGQQFSLAISNVTGYRATARLQLGSIVTNANVSISDASFHIADSKFILNSDGSATLATAVTEPVGGTISVKTAAAARI